MVSNKSSAFSTLSFESRSAFLTCASLKPISINEDSDSRFISTGDNDDVATLSCRLFTDEGCVCLSCVRCWFILLFDDAEATGGAGDVK